MLFEPSVLPGHVTGGSGIDDKRVLGLSCALQRPEHAPYVAVEEFDGRVIGGSDPLLFRRRQVAEDCRDLCVVFGIDRRNGEFTGFVPASVLHWKMKWRMRFIETDHE